MPPKVTYWTGTWSPGREAISNEIAALRQQSKAPVVSFSTGQRSRLFFSQRVLQLSGRQWLLLRAIAAAVEPAGQVTHLFGELGPWHLLRALGRRPLVFTVAIPGPPVEPALYDRVTLFAAESLPLAQALLHAGVSTTRLRVVYPGVDLARFTPVTVPTITPFRLLFASTPADPAEFEGRGIPLLIELARAEPDIEVILLWRRWGDPRAALHHLEALAPPPNVVIRQCDVDEMASVYQQVHATACFFSADTGKSCPNSIIESLACGRPVLLSDTCGIASLVDEAGAGVASPRDVRSLRHGLEFLRRNHDGCSKRARLLAQQHFGLEGFRDAYSSIYRDLMEGHRGVRRGARPRRVDR